MSVGVSLENKRIGKLAKERKSKQREKVNSRFIERTDCDRSHTLETTRDYQPSPKII